MQVVVQRDSATASVSVKGGEWSVGTTSVSFARWDETLGIYAPLPGAQNVQALGGFARFQDLEMPIGTTVTYRAMNEHGQAITASASSSNVEWGLWLKSRKAPELTSRIEWEEVGDVTSETQGSVYQVHGGGGVGQFGGIAPERFTLYGWVDGRIAYNKLRALFNADRQIFIQTGEPKEFDDGWVQVISVAFPNAENRLIEKGSGMRYVSLDCTRINEPVGAARGGLGSPYRLVYTGYDDYQDLYDSGAVYGDLLEVS